MSRLLGMASEFGEAKIGQERASSSSPPVDTYTNKNCVATFTLWDAFSLIGRRVKRQVVRGILSRDQMPFDRGVEGGSQEDFKNNMAETEQLQKKRTLWFDTKCNNNFHLSGNWLIKAQVKKTSFSTSDNKKVIFIPVN
jgi:hypothetical protein